LEIAKQYYLKGSKVVISARREKLLKEAVEETKKNSGGDIQYFVCDATNETSIKNLVDFTIKTYNKLDVAIYAAGISMHTLFEKIKDINKVYNTIMVKYF
jgi:3-oxoacyl-[acyl-carrier protein] reductase